MEIINMTNFNKKIMLTVLVAVMMLSVSLFAACGVVTTYAESISLDKSTVTLAPQGTATLVATVEPADAEGSVVWTSSDGAVATVSGGTVTAVAVGTSTITVSAATEDGWVSATCDVVVALTPTAKYTGTLTIDNITSSGFKLVASEAPVGGRTLEYSLDGITYQSSQDFTGSATDVVSAFVRYAATATHAASDPVEVEFYAVDTEVYAESLAVTDKSVTLTLGGATYNIDATTEPAYVSVGINYIVADTSVVTVKNGVLTPVGVGSTTVTVSTRSRSAVSGVVSPIEEVINVTVVSPTAGSFDGTATATLASETVTISTTGSATAGTLEYSIDGINWQSSNVFDNVTATQLIAYVRVAGTTTASPSDATPILVGSGDIDAIHSSSIIFTAPSLSINVGVTGSIASFAFVTPFDYAGEIYWYSSDSSIVSINSQGIVTAHTAGTATITVSAIARDVDEEVIISDTITIVSKKLTQSAYTGGFEISATTTGLELEPLDSTAAGLLEYSLDGETWSATSAFDASLTDQLVVYARYAATDTLTASEHTVVLASVPQDSITLAVDTSFNDGVFVYGDSAEGIVISVTTSDGRTSQYSVDEATKASIQLLGFDTTSIGNKTMTVSYMGTSVTVDYSVVYFLGAGTSTDPYQIDTVEQFYMYRDFNQAEVEALNPPKDTAPTVATTSFLGKYFALTSDIAIDATSDADAWVTDRNSTMAGTLDGDGHTITVKSSSALYILFHTVGTVDSTGEPIDTVIKNINFDFTGAVGIATSVMYNVTLQDINIYGEIECSNANYSPIVIYAGFSFTTCVFGAQTMGEQNFVNINIYANIEHTGGYMGIIVGSGFFYEDATTTSYNMTNCHLYGNVSGNNVGFVNGNQFYHKNLTANNTVLTVDNCGVDDNAVIMATAKASFMPVNDNYVTNYTGVVIKNSIYDENGNAVNYDGVTAICPNYVNIGSSITNVSTSAVTVDEHRRIVLDTAVLQEQLGELYDTVDSVIVTSYYESYRVVSATDKPNNKVKYADTLTISREDNASYFTDDSIYIGSYAVPVVAVGDMAQLEAQWVGSEDSNPYTNPILGSSGTGSVPATDTLLDADGHIIAYLHRQAGLPNDKLAPNDVVGDENIYVCHAQLYFSFYFYNADGARIGAIIMANPTATAGTYGVDSENHNLSALDYLLGVEAVA